MAGFSPASPTGFVEGNSAQYTWMVPQDVTGLVKALGGAGAAAERLDSYFTQLNAGVSEPHAFMSDEPSFGDPWLYDWVGRPWRTQEVTRRIETTLYDDTPSGLADNDDLGALSAWYVWATLGLYPVIPGVGSVAVGSPLFPKVTITLATGAQIVITGSGAAATAPYVQTLSLNGTSLKRSWLNWSDLADGAVLDFTLGPSPSRWAAAYTPPSFDVGLAPGIGYLDDDSVSLEPGHSATVDVGVQNLQVSMPLRVTWAPDMPAGVTAGWAGGATDLVVSPGDRAEIALSLTASQQAALGTYAVPLNLHTADGTALPLTVIEVSVS